MNQNLIKRLAAFKAGKYNSPFKFTDYSSRWGGQVFKVGENVGWKNIFGRWHESPETPFRFVGLAHEIISLRHTGWYTRHEDCPMDELARGVVYLLPHDRFIAAIADPFNARKNGQGPCVVECKPNGEPFIYDSKEEAARNADNFAERYAESAREDDRIESRRSLLEQDMEDAQATINEAREDVRGLLSEIRASVLSPGLCERLKREVKAIRAKMHREWRDLVTARKELATLNA